MLIAAKRREALYYALTPEARVTWCDTECLPPGWLPAAISATTIRWIRVGCLSPTAPFFERWLAELRCSVPPPREHETELSSLAQAVAHLPEVAPAGIIFHLSRCGSTLLSNALSAGEDVFALSEAPAIEVAARLAASPVPRAASLGASAATALCKAFAHYRSPLTRQLVIKTGMGAVAWLRSLRSLWPDVPCVMLIRDPLEVAVSNLQRPPRALTDWYDAPSTCFASAPDEALGRGIGEFCAWLVGRICSEALEQIDDRCLVLDYRDLTPEAALSIAEFFSVRLSGEAGDALRRAFQFDAKRGGVFQPDSDRKKKSAAATLVESVDRWALGPYQALLSSPWRLQAA